MLNKNPVNNYWENIYASGQQCNVAPFDEVIAFVYKNKPNKSHVRILEVGCGTGNNLEFLLKQGFDVIGIDGSKTAIKMAGEKIGHHNVHFGSFSKLPFYSIFDMVIDRAALSFASELEIVMAIDEIHRVLLPNGKFLFTPFAKSTKDGANLYSQSKIKKLLSRDKWNIEIFDQVNTIDLVSDKLKESHYRVVATKI